jgi:hypothetical protein
MTTPVVPSPLFPFPQPEVAVDTRIVDEMIRAIHATKPFSIDGPVLLPPMVLQSEAKLPTPFQPSDIEFALKVKLPEEIKLLWSRASELRLHEDVNYGQWGCVLWSPIDVVARHRQACDQRRSEDFRPGDVIVGEFRGDTDLVVLRCDSSQKDYGRIVIALAMDSRNEWPCVSSSLVDFVLTFLSQPDKKFWEVIA